MKRILAIGAHYDDIEIGCAGTIFKHIQNGDQIFFAITSVDESRTGHPRDRAIEQDKAAEMFGLNNRFLYYFSEKHDDVAEVVGVLDTIKPDIVFAQHEYDTHQAHRRSSIIAQAVGRKQHITTIFYDSGSSYEFKPNTFSLIDYNKKEEILKCFESQIIHGAINLDRVKKKNSFWATLVTTDPDAYAEGFKVRKSLWLI